MSVKPANVHSIVAVHGLNGDPFRTWTTESDKLWLKDPSLLPSNLKNSRILTYGYNAMVTAVLGKTSSDRILQHAQTLVAELVADREVSLLRGNESVMATNIERVAGRRDATVGRRWPIPQPGPVSSFNMCTRSTSRHSGFYSWEHLMMVAAKPSLLPLLVA